MSAIGPDAPMCVVCDRRHNHHLTCTRAAEIEAAIDRTDAIATANSPQAIAQERIDEITGMHRQIAGLRVVLAVLRGRVGNDEVDDAIVRAVDRYGATLPGEVLAGVTGPARPGDEAAPAGSVARV